MTGDTEPPPPLWFDELALGASAAEMRRASEWLDATCQQRGVPLVQVERLLLCLDEVLANVMTHGCRPAPTEPIAVRLEVDFGQARVTVSDACKAFDPLSVPKRPQPKTLEEAAPGGLGLPLIRRCSDLLHYRHHDGRNHFTFGMRWM